MGMSPKKIPWNSTNLIFLSDGLSSITLVPAGLHTESSARFVRVSLALPSPFPQWRVGQKTLGRCTSTNHRFFGSVQVHLLAVVSQDVSLGFSRGFSFRQHWSKFSSPSKVSPGPFSLLFISSLYIFEASLLLYQPLLWAIVLGQIPRSFEISLFVLKNDVA